MRKVVTMHGRTAASGRRRLASALVALAIAACSGAPAPQAGAADVGDAPADAGAAAAQVEIESVELIPAAAGATVELLTTGPLVWTTYRDADENLVVELPNSRAAVGPGRPGAGRRSGRRGPLRARRQRRPPPDPGGHRDARGRRARGGRRRRAAARRAGAGSTRTGRWRRRAAASAAEEPPRMARWPMDDRPTDETGRRDRRRADGRSRSSRAPLAALPATRLVGVEVERSGEVIHVLGDGEFYHSSFSLENPDRFVVDLVGVVNAAPQAAVAVGGDAGRAGAPGAVQVAAGAHRPRRGRSARARRRRRSSATAAG